MEFYAEELQMTIYLMNRSSSKAIWPRCHMHYGRENNRPIIGFVYSDAKQMHSFQGRIIPHSTKCIFLDYGIDGDFRYRMWDTENWKLIRTSDVVFNEGSIISGPTKSWTDKRVSFDYSPTEFEVDMPHTEPDLTNNLPAEPKSAKGPIVESQSARKSAWQLANRLVTYKL